MEFMSKLARVMWLAGLYEILSELLNLHHSLLLGVIFVSAAVLIAISLGLIEGLWQKYGSS